MSYDISYCCKCCGALIKVPESFEEGGTYAIGGTDECHLNVTYNYSRYFYDKLDKKKGIRWLYGKTGEKTMDRLTTAISFLGDDVSRDYWEPTEGNAKRALEMLLKFAKANPLGVWSGD